MSRDPATMRFRIVMFALTTCAVAFALIHSSMPAEVSAEESGGVLDLLVSFFKSVGLNVELTDHMVRKAAHFTEYTVIGVLLSGCAYSFDRIKPYRYYSQVFLFGLASAVCDETVQLNVAGRSGQISDVLLDFSGIVFGVLVMLLLFMLCKRFRRVN